jgi:hypothetical protein
MWWHALIVMALVCYAISLFMLERVQADDISLADRNLIKGRLRAVQVIQTLGGLAVMVWLARQIFSVTQYGITQ